MSRMSRRAFLGFRFSEEDAGTRDVPGGVPPETPLPPEFSPAMLRAWSPVAPSGTVVPTPGASAGSRKSTSKLTCRWVSASTPSSASSIARRIPTSSM